ncbi:glycosyltransferase family 87 protein [Neoroseomonas oryzicola]|uniref:DUF2029 domain-containing protein n=1 Tax=Neoroseomonas oryzicola TaxID=535904 RepID=A0A9X9WGA4_9PROT|nr:glycosyltransferase family 87 protein [Neoroseomonas oryzicola]MBR0659364.1 DUF2029 domain-containing protein [Neoroseomonas oryzicola]NKE16265.1 DUF2029 domain-containing protein [Neoroseomonas oryzicola]
MSRLAGILREAPWLTADRATAWCRVLAIAPLLLVVATTAWVVANGFRPLSPTGEPVGTDFVSFYGASALVLAGMPEAAYVQEAHAAAQAGAVGALAPGHYYAFQNPPPYLLLIWPLAILPYLGALLAWLLVTGAAYAVAAARVAGLAMPVSALMAFPALLANLGHGQNGLLSAALLGFAALWLDRRPVAAGIAIGLLCYKPHLALLAPVALAAAGRWRSFAAAGVTVGALVLASLMAFGPDTWRGFLATSGLSMEALELGLAGPGKMQSTFAAVRLFGGSVALAYALHGIVVLVAAVAIARAARGADGLALGAMIAAGGALASPYIHDYDLAILAVPLAYVFREARLSGTFLPWEKTVLGLCFLLPLVARMLSMNLYLPVTPPLVACLLAVVIRRSRATLR